MRFITGDQMPEETMNKQELLAKWRKIQQDEEPYATKEVMGCIGEVIEDLEQLSDRIEWVAPSGDKWHFDSNVVPEILDRLIEFGVDPKIVEHAVVAQVQKDLKEPKE